VKASQSEKMKNKIKKLENSKIEVEITLDKAEFQQYYQPIYEDALAGVELKGYRKGTAPKEMADQAINKTKVFEAALEDAIRHSLDEVKIENDWTFIDQPQIEVTESVSGGLTYKATLTLFPEVKLPDYKAIAKEIFSQERKTDVSEEEMTKTTQWILESRAKETSANRPAKMGDLLEIDLEAFTGGKSIPNTAFQKERFILGDSKFITGFDEALVGKSDGDDLDFTLTAPKDYWQKELQGKDLQFKGKVIGVYERDIPKLTDEFAASLAPTFKTVADLHKSMREGLGMEKDQKELERQRLEVLAKINDKTKVEIPDILLERTLDGMVEQMKQSMPAPDDKTGETLDKELREKLRDKAAKNVTSHLVLYKIAQTEKLEPTQEEVAAQAQKHGVDPETHGGYIYDTVQTQKVFEFLQSQAPKKES